MAQQATTTAASHSLFTDSFATFSVDDVVAAREFYSTTLGLDVRDEMEGLVLKLPGVQSVFLYPKNDHESASFTVLNFEVENIEHAVDELIKRGLAFESYDEPMKTDENGIYWGTKQGRGPNIAWFKDPARNILSIIEKE